MKKAKIIFSDIDGTINLYDDQLTIIEEEVIAINKLTTNNKFFVFSTGNSLLNLKKYLKQININDYSRYAIANSGAIIYDAYQDKVIFETTIPISTVIKLVEYALEIKAWVVISESNHFFIAGKVNVFLGNLLRRYKKIPKVERFNDVKLLQRLTTDIHKIDIGFQKLQKISVDFKNKILKKLHRIDKNLEVAFQSNSSFQITYKNVNKGSALIWLCNHLNIPIDESLVIGDGANDLPMFKVAKHAIALENSNDDLKQLSTFITKANIDNGLSHLIENYLIIESDE